MRNGIDDEPLFDNRLPAVVPAIENFVPSCVVCKAPVPHRRIHNVHNRNTCSPDCATVMRRFHDHILNQTRCPSCYHPSTPEERREFSLWRKHRGDLQEHRGRPAKSTTEVVRLRYILQQAVELLRTAGVHSVADLVSASERLQNLLDEPPKP